jgi:hypothetical protein
MMPPAPGTQTRGGRVETQARPTNTIAGKSRTAPWKSELEEIIFGPFLKIDESQREQD